MGQNVGVCVAAEMRWGDPIHRIISVSCGTRQNGCAVNMLCCYRRRKRWAEEEWLHMDTRAVIRRPVPVGTRPVIDLPLLSWVPSTRPIHSPSSSFFFFSSSLAFRKPLLFFSFVSLNRRYIPPILLTHLPTTTDRRVHRTTVA